MTVALLHKKCSVFPTIILLTLSVIINFSILQLLFVGHEHEQNTFMNNNNNNTNSSSIKMKKQNNNRNTNNHKRIKNYFHEIWKGSGTTQISSSISRNKLLKNLSSIKVVTTYIKQHSQEQLEKEYIECNSNNKNQSTSACPSLSNRKFMIGLYSCPDESGNRLHLFMNALLIAIATNRTLLWRYNTLETIQEYDVTRIRVAKNYNVKDCDAVLKRSSWIPSYKEWHSKLNLSLAIRADFAERDIHTMPYDNDKSPNVIHLGFTYLHNPGDILTKPNLKKHIIKYENIQRIMQLNSFRNVYYVYGLLFESLFTIHDWIYDDYDNSNHNSSLATLPYKENYESYFIHARHQVKAMDGSYIWHEIFCLRKLLGRDETSATVNNEQNNNSLSYPNPCVIYLLSDREKTIELLTPIIYNMSCTPIIANHTASSSWISAEHGPWAGIGFWQDLSLAINARTGYISFHNMNRPYARTSTALLIQLVEFRRIIEFINDNITSTSFDDISSVTSASIAEFEKKITIPKLKRCENPHTSWGVDV